MDVHPNGCDCGSYGCELRSKGVQISPAGMVRHNRKNPAKHVNNNWEKGKAPPEDRPGGFKMPRFDAMGDEIPIKQWTEGKFDKALKSQKQNRALNDSQS